MEVGKLYKTKKLYWFLYRSQDDTDISLAALRTVASPAEVAQFVRASRSPNLPFIPPNSFFVLLEKKQKYCKVLSHEGNIGWIYLAEWCKDDIEEVLFREAE